MSATFALSKQENELAKLLALASLNKEDIAAAAEETRKQIQLTKEEEVRVTEARLYISKCDKISADLLLREDALVKARADHEQAVADFIDRVSTENVRLEAFSAELQKKEHLLIATEQKINSLESDNADRQALMISKNKEIEDALANEKRINVSIAKANEQEQIRLIEWENTLKRKAEIARQKLADF